MCLFLPVLCQAQVAAPNAGSAAPLASAPAKSANFVNPNSVAVDSSGGVYFSNRAENGIFKLDGTGTLRRIAGTETQTGHAGDGGPVIGGQLYPIQGVAADSAGNLFFADANRIRKVSPDGTITLVAGNGGFGYGGDGGPASAALFALPAGLAVDAAGTLFIADTGNHRIRKVTVDGTISTVAGTGIYGISGDGSSAIDAQLSYPAGVAVDGEGNLFIADAGNNRIRKVSHNGVITTVAGTGVYGFFGDGGPAVNAQLKAPSAVTVDFAGNLFIADQYNHRIRKVAPGGAITTVAGNGIAGFSGDGGPAASAQLGTPTGLAVDAAGNLYVADANNRRVRKVTTGNTIVTVAGGSASTSFTSSESRSQAGANQADSMVASSAPDIACVANSAVPPNSRQEGLTELVGDVVLTCTGGTPIPAGTIVPRMTLTLFLNAQITSGLMRDGSEVFLAIDEPTAAQAKVCVPGTANPAAPADPNSCPVVGTGGSTNEFKSGNANIIRGTISGNRVTFAGVPVDPPGNASSRIYRITNLRANASQIAPAGDGSPGQVIGLLQASDSSLAIQINNPTQVMAMVQPSLATSIRTADDSSPLDAPLTFQQCAPASPTKVANLVFTEGFPSAFRTRTASTTAAGDVTVQNVFGLAYDTESGYYNPELTGTSELPGLADFGTRLKAVFYNIPAGVTLYAGTEAASAAGAPAIGSGKSQANLTANELGAWAPVSPTETLDGVPAAALISMDGSATAIWEIAGADAKSIESFRFPLWISYSGASTGAVSVNASYAPTPPSFNASAGSVAQDTTFPMARFIDNSSASSIFQIASCGQTTPVTFNTSPAGRTIVIDGSPFTAPQTVEWTPGSSHSVGTVLAGAGAATRHAFSNWSDGGAQLHSIKAPSSAATYIATFTTQHLLTTAVAAAGDGTVTANPPSNDGYYDSGASVQLTAAPASGVQFAGWSGDLTGAANQQTVVVSAPRRVTASFTTCVYPLSANGVAADGSPSNGSFNVTASSGCGWTASSDSPWITITSGGFGSGSGAVGYSVAANNGPRRSGTITAAGQTLAITQQAPVQPPSPTSVSPSSGNVSAQPMTFTFDDPRGFQDLGVLNILINNFLDGRHACYMAYVAQSNLLLLVDDAGDAGGPFIGQMTVDGSAATIENSQCRISGVGSSRSANGTTLTLTLNMTFKPGLAGNRVVWMAARDQAQNNSDWQALGIWQVPGSTPTVITAVSADPPRVVGSGSTYTFTITDTKGAADIGFVNVLINSFIDGRHACYLAYIAQSKLLVLVNDAGDAGGPFAGALTLGDPGTIGNSQCTVSLNSATANGNQLTLSLGISATAAFAGNRILFVAARDPNSGNNTDWQSLGTWSVQPGLVSGAITLASASIGKDLQTSVALSLSAPAPSGGVSVSLTSSDATRVLIGGNNSANLGTQSLTVSIPQGISTVTVVLQGLANNGTATVTATSPGWTPGSAAVTLTPSGFVLAGPNGIGIPSFQTNVGINTPLTVSAARLNSLLNYAETQQLRGGATLANPAGLVVTVPLNSSNNGVGTISPTSVVFNSGDTSANVTFTAVGVGNTTLSAGTPGGFSTPANGSVVANVGTSSLVPSNVTVGPNLENTASVTLNGAPSLDVSMTLTSNDPSKALLSTTPNGAGQTTITVLVKAGFSHTPDFYVYGLANSGSTTYSATLNGFGTANGTITLVPTAVVIAGPFGLGSTITTTPGAAPTTLTVITGTLDAGGNFAQALAVSGQGTVSANVTSGNNAVGAITASPVQIPPGSASTTTQFQPAGNGSTSISVNVPPGFSTPAQFGSVAVTVSAAGMSITDGVSIGNKLAVAGVLTLGQAPPAGGVTVTLTSSDSNRLRLAASPTAAGSGTIMLTIVPPATNAFYYIYSLDSTGTASYTATANGYASRTASAITLTPSGFVLEGSFGVGSQLFAPLSSGNTTFFVHPAQLDAGGGFSQTQQLAGGQSVIVPLSNIPGGDGTVPSQVTVVGGSDTTAAQFHSVSAGTSTVTAGTPSGFTTPTSGGTMAVSVF